MRGEVKLQKLEIEKQVDASTCDLMFRSMQGTSIPSIEIQMVETAKGGTANFPFLSLRFEEVFLSEWNLNLDSADPKESLQFRYQKVAIEYHSTKDGITYKREATRGWDVDLKDSKGNYGAPWEYSFKLRGVGPSAKS